MDFITSALWGGAAGIAYGVTGWLKSGNDLNVMRMAPTVVLAGLGGALAVGWFGMPVGDDAVTSGISMLSSVGIGEMLKNLLKMANAPGL